MRSSIRAKALDIPQWVKDEVWERDHGRCVICGSYGNCMPNAHFISRAHGGLGIPQNVFTACTTLSINKCHFKFDSGADWERKEHRERVRRYLKLKYPGWDEADLVYQK